MENKDINVTDQSMASRGIAYTVEDILIGDFDVRKSANAWWMKSNKVELLISSLKQGHTIKAACIIAGISRGQWQHFNKVHPEFIHIIEMCEQVQIEIALETVHRNLKDPKMARWFLEKRHPKFKTRFTMDDLQGRQLPSVESNFGFYDENIDDPEYRSDTSSRAQNQKVDYFFSSIVKIRWSNILYPFKCS